MILGHHNKGMKPRFLHFCWKPYWYLHTKVIIFIILPLEFTTPCFGFGACMTHWSPSEQFYNFSLSIYLSTGTSFLCSVLVAPVKNENEEIIMCILNFEDISENKYASTPEETATPAAAENNSVGYKWRRGRSK